MDAGRLFGVRLTLLAALLISTACTADAGDGPSFGSGSPTGAGSSAGSTGSASSAEGGTSANDAGTTSAGAGSETGSEAGPDSNTTDADTTSATDPSAGSTTADPTSGGESTGVDPTGAGTPLDPNLDVPDEGESCSFPGNLNECPGIAVCRYYTAEEGRCESCDTCGNLGASCTEGTDCDILFSCYAGRCTNFCELGTFNCGPVEDCLDIGHPTHGVCDPLA